MTSSNIILAHGSGGRLSSALIDEVFFPAFNNPILNQAHDGALLTMDSSRLAFSTDSFVVNPCFFPGGNIGDLAVNGTVNDIAMCGAVPQFLSAAFILEEGFAIKDLKIIVKSMAEAARTAQVKVVTGDTKVVERGSGDGIFINTSGLGFINHQQQISPQNVQVGDVVITNGYIGDHGIAILSQREGLSFETTIESDSAALHSLVAAILNASSNIHLLRDPTRGGLAGILNEIAQASQTEVRLKESAIPIRDSVQAACDLLGLDPLIIANEGKLIVIVPQADSEAVLKAMQRHPLGRESAVIGQVLNKNAGKVTLETTIGSLRMVEMPLGEQLPRIC
ncbi:hydrogenase expression/formation protein HypE [Psychromonas aquimarina]|uniref:hydrogenase expression/formation protein HypE n=1 Tax=Psychromonas aquimarina TaxID=444919 RepID=UPI000424FE9A|nr:hydrogenase expression/formation protein HypE [Psychromonas aquimarina]